MFQFACSGGSSAIYSNSKPQKLRATTFQPATHAKMQLSENLITRARHAGETSLAGRAEKWHRAQIHSQAHLGALSGQICIRFTHQRSIYEAWLNVISHSIKWKLLKYSTQQQSCVWASTPLAAKHTLQSRCKIMHALISKARLRRPEC